MKTKTEGEAETEKGTQKSNCKLFTKIIINRQG